jgi:hypothetical protein
MEVTRQLEWNERQLVEHTRSNSFRPKAQAEDYGADETAGEYPGEKDSEYVYGGWR